MAGRRPSLPYVMSSSCCQEQTSQSGGASAPPFCLVLNHAGSRGLRAFLISNSDSSLLAQDAPVGCLPRECFRYVYRPRSLRTVRSHAPSKAASVPFMLSSSLACAAIPTAPASNEADAFPNRSHLSCLAPWNMIEYDQDSGRGCGRWTIEFQLYMKRVSCAC
jgi:hypothetical protein